MKSICWHFYRQERGTISVLMALLLIPLTGAVALGFEASNWYLTVRSMQNAADAAALAAATNASGNYDVEAKAVAARYGFVNGASNVSISVTNAAACPGGGNNCYSVTISVVTPLLLSSVVGFRGDATLNGAAAKMLSSSAVAARAMTPMDFCLVSLGSKGVRSNGAPKSSMACNVMSNTGSTCNGGDLGAPIGAAHGTNDGCGISKYSNIPAVVDPYAALASKIPPDPCTSYPQKPGKNGPPLPSSNKWTGLQSMSGNTFVCGDLQLTGNVTIDAPAGAVLIIENGQLDTNGYSISTSNGSGLTLIFSGVNGPYTHAPTGGGVLDIAAPTSGPWKGVAMYQDPKLTTGVDIADAGNVPSWNITGLVYLPNASVTLSGAVQKAGYGKSCFAIIVMDIVINGTGMILPNGECIPAGLNMPNTSLVGRASLVL